VPIIVVSVALVGRESQKWSTGWPEG
jgi:hypothetical protein